MSEAISILVADNDDAWHGFYQEVFNQAGHQYIPCRTGAEAINYLNGNQPRLFIVDTGMDNGNGVNIMRGASQLHPSMPILVVANADSKEYVMDCIANGASDFLVKPVSAIQLLAKIDFLVKMPKLAANVAQQSADAPGTSTTMEPGSTFFGKYEIDHFVSSSGFSSIFKAFNRNENPARAVALKTYNFAEEVKEDISFIRSFLRESFLLSKLNNENIVKLVDVGQSHGLYFIAMEYVSGNSLKTILDQDGMMSEDSLVMIAYEISKALIDINLHFVVHRDLTPDNIMINGEGDIKIIGFGLASDQDDPNIEEERAPVNYRPEFASPELIKNEVILDVSTDVYSLGVTMFYAATLSYPIEGVTPRDYVRGHLEETPKNLKELRPDFSDEFCELIMRMLDKDRDNRPDVADLNYTLKRMLIASMNQ